MKHLWNGDNSVTFTNTYKFDVTGSPLDPVVSRQETATFTVYPDTFSLRVHLQGSDRTFEQADLFNNNGIILQLVQELWFVLEAHLYNNQHHLDSQRFARKYCKMVSKAVGEAVRVAKEAYLEDPLFKLCRRFHGMHLHYNTKIEILRAIVTDESLYEEAMTTLALPYFIDTLVYKVTLVGQELFSINLGGMQYTLQGTPQLLSSLANYAALLLPSAILPNPPFRKFLQTGVTRLRDRSLLAEFDEKLMGDALFGKLSGLEREHYLMMKRVKLPHAFRALWCKTPAKERVNAMRHFRGTVPFYGRKRLKPFEEIHLHASYFFAELAQITPLYIPLEATLQTLIQSLRIVHVLEQAQKRFARSDLFQDAFGLSVALRRDGQDTSLQLFRNLLYYEEITFSPSLDGVLVYCKEPSTIQYILKIFKFKDYDIFDGIDKVALFHHKTTATVQAILLTGDGGFRERVYPCSESTELQPVV